MTKPQEPKRYDIRTYSDIDNFPLYDRVLEKEGQYMLAEEALAYAEAVRNEALEEAANILDLYVVMTNERNGSRLHMDTNRGDVLRSTYAEKIRSLKREWK